MQPSESNPKTSTPNEGMLDVVSVPQLLAEAWRDQRSGRLRVAQGKSERLISIVEGAPVAVESSLEDEHLAQSLEDAGLLTTLDRSRVRKLAQERGCPEASAVLALRLVDAKELYRAIRKETRAQIAATFEWTGGGYQWLELEADTKSRAKPFDILELLQDQLPKRWDTNRLFEALMAIADCHGDIAPRFRRVARKLAAADPNAARAIARLDGSQPLGRILGECAGDPTTAATLWTLMHAGILRITDAEARKTTAVALEFEVEVDPTGGAQRPARDRVAPRTGAARQSNPQADALREEIGSLVPQLASLDHYSALGLAQDAKAGEIKKAYFKAAKRYHPDSLAKLGLEDLKDDAANVFGRIAEAFETLADPRKRDAYDRGGSDEPEIDTARLAQAETSYRKGEILLRMGNFAGALEYLAPAVELWPDEPAYQAALGWALYKQPKSDPARACEHLELARSKGSEDPVTLYRLGVVLRSLGDRQESDVLIARAHSLDPSVEE